MAYVRILLLLLLSSSAQAQTLAEWFNQKKTQKKYLLQQISALQVYSGYLKNGYNIAKGGLGSIGDYLSNEYNLHDDHYQQLQKVNSVIKDDAQVKDILRWQQNIITQTTAVKRQAGLTSAEEMHVKKVCTTLLADCDAQLNDLLTITTDNKAEMSDEERLRQIARIHAAMQDNYRFAAAFQSQLSLYVRNKTAAQHDVNTLSRLYENH